MTNSMEVSIHYFSLSMQEIEKNLLLDVEELASVLIRVVDRMVERSTRLL
jgi:hypothetical protein